jgi:hypothetical protein
MYTANTRKASSGLATHLVHLTTGNPGLGDNMSELTGLKMPTATLVAPATAQPDYRHAIGGNPGFAPQKDPYVKEKHSNSRGYLPTPKDNPAPQGPVDGGWKPPLVEAKDHQDGGPVTGGAKEGYNTPTKGGMSFGKDAHLPAGTSYPWNKKDNDPARPDNAPGPLQVLQDLGKNNTMLLLAAAAVVVVYKMTR